MMKFFFVLVALAASLPIWGQVYQPSEAEPGMSLVHQSNWTGPQPFLIGQSYNGDDRQGWGGVTGNFGFIGEPPAYYNDPGSLNYEFWWSCEWNGVQKPGKLVIGTAATNQRCSYNSTTGYWSPDVSQALTPSLYLSWMGAPPGIYDMWLRGKGSRGSSPIATLGVRGWYCPRLVKYAIKIVNGSNQPIANFPVTVVYNGPIDPNWHPQTWRTVNTDGSGMAYMILPSIPSTVSIAGLPGVSYPYAPGVFTPVGPPISSPSPSWYTLTVKVNGGAATFDGIGGSEPTQPANPETGGVGTVPEGFFQSLFIPSQTTLANWDLRRSRLSAWGPVAYVQAFWGTWMSTARSLSIDADADTAPHPGYLISLDGGTSHAGASVDLRPMGGVSGTAQGVGSFAGSLWRPIRVFEGWMVYILAVLALWRWIRPRLHA